MTNETKTTTREDFEAWLAQHYPNVDRADRDGMTMLVNHFLNEQEEQEQINKG